MFKAKMQGKLLTQHKKRFKQTIENTSC